MKSNWKLISVDGYPKTGDLCWLYDINGYHVWLGCLVLIDETMYWSIASNNVYPVDWKITADCEFEYINITHWQQLPTLPKM